jgi:hypothetical protein
MLLKKKENIDISKATINKVVSIRPWCQIYKHTTTKTYGLLKPLQTAKMLVEFFFGLVWAAE